MDENNVGFTLIAGTIVFFWLRGRGAKIEASCKHYLEDETSDKYTGYMAGRPLERLRGEIFKDHLFMLVCGTGIGVGFNETVWLILSLVGL